MCLNCLPQFEKFLFCISINDAVIIIFKVGLLLYTPLFILSVIDSKKLGLAELSNVNFGSWFTTVAGLWMMSSMLLVVVVSRCVKNDDVRDIILQVYFWLVVATSVIHLVFCITLLIMCWQKCIVSAVMHLSAFVIHLLVTSYTVLIVNSYRMSLF